MYSKGRGEGAREGRGDEGEGRSEGGDAGGDECQERDLGMTQGRELDNGSWDHRDWTGIGGRELGATRVRWRGRLVKGPQLEGRDFKPSVGGRDTWEEVVTRKVQLHSVQPWENDSRNSKSILALP
jgi:hypothetical protein